MYLAYNEPIILKMQDVYKGQLQGERGLNK